jgi:hypothetical protein
MQKFTPARSINTHDHTGEGPKLKTRRRFAERANASPPESGRPSLRILRGTTWQATDPPYRAIMLVSFYKPRDVSQPFDGAAPDRYPRILRFVQDSSGAEDASSWAIESPDA